MLYPFGTVNQLATPAERIQTQGISVDLASIDKIFSYVFFLFS